jgi:hypothetical protein
MTETAPFIGAPLAGEAIPACVLSSLRFAVWHIYHAQVIRKFFKWHYYLHNSSIYHVYIKIIIPNRSKWKIMTGFCFFQGDTQVLLTKKAFLYRIIIGPESLPFMNSTHS